MIKTTATKNNELSKNFFLSYLSFFILIFISILIIAFVSFFSAKSTLTNLGETALKNKIQMGLAMMDSLETEVKKGKIKREEAQEIFRVKMLNSKQADGKTRGNNKKLELDIKAYMYAINSNGVEVMHPFKEGEDVSGLRDSEGRNLTKLIIEEGKNPKNDGIVNFEWKNPNEVMKKPKINVVGYFEPWDWHINVGCYKQDFYKSAYKMLSLILLISIVILLVSFIILRNLMVKKVNPLSEIVNSMENVSKGQLNLNLDINRKDEIGYIANVFNKMVEDIKDILISIKGISTTLQEKANNIDSSSDGTLDNSNNIKEAMEQISESINNTSKEIENSFENIKELSNNIMSIKENSITMKNKMEQASNLNNNIVNVLNELENKNSENIEVSKETNYNIKTLLEKSNTIVGIVSTIDEISDQINLLALNASIESARAGQAGKGFEVVAEEIKNLSNKTSEAVKKISELINELISVINLSVESVGRAGDVAESQVEIINETRSTLMNVSDFIEKMPKIIQNNVDKIEEAYEKQEKINSSMASVIAVSEEISASSEEITSSTGEVNNNINSIKNLSEELSVFSEELNNKINQFSL